VVTAAAAATYREHLRLCALLDDRIAMLCVFARFAAAHGRTFFYGGCWS